MFRWIKNKIKAIFGHLIKKKENNDTLLITSVNNTAGTITFNSNSYFNTGLWGGAINSSPSIYVPHGSTITTTPSGSVIWNNYPYPELTNLQREEQDLQTMGMGARQGYFDADGNYHFFNYYHSLSNLYSNYYTQWANSGTTIISPASYVAMRQTVTNGTGTP